MGACIPKIRAVREVGDTYHPSSKRLLLKWNHRMHIIIHLINPYSRSYAHQHSMSIWRPIELRRRRGSAVNGCVFAIGSVRYAWFVKYAGVDAVVEAVFFWGRALVELRGVDRSCERNPTSCRRPGTRHVLQLHMCILAERRRGSIAQKHLSMGKK